MQTTDSSHANPVAPNVLDQNFASADGPNKVWGVDITYIHTGEGVLYLAGVMDLFSRKIVGWSMDDTMTTDLVERAFSAAVLSRRPSSPLLHHSDRGVQYTSGRYRDLLKQHGVAASMSRTGNCYDNAVVESFWGSSRPRRCTTNASPPRHRPAPPCSSTSRCSTTAGVCTPP